jgi:FkbM family methyltransferase
MKDYSQNGEQLLITRYFQGRQRGTLLSVGENDGETFSMARALMLDGWRGVLIEPSLAAFQKLCTLYGAPDAGVMSEIKLGQATLVRAAITDKDGPIDLYDSGTHLKKGDVALLSTTRPEEMDRWKPSGETFTKTSVRGITFKTLMEQAGESHFDFVSIDAEGADYSILCQIDLRAVGCELLCVEYNAKDEHKFIGYAVGAGMKLVHRNYENLLFSV